MATLGKDPIPFKNGVAVDVSTSNTKRIGLDNSGNDYIMRFILTTDADETANFINFSIELESESNEIWNGYDVTKYYFHYKIGTDPNELAGQSFISDAINETENRVRVSTSNSNKTVKLTFETNREFNANQTYYIWIYRLYVGPDANYNGYINWWDDGSITYDAPTLTTVEASLSNLICFQNYESDLGTLDAGAIWKQSGVVVGRFVTNETTPKRAIGTVRYDLTVNKTDGASGLAIHIPCPYEGSYLYADKSTYADAIEAGNLKLKVIITPYDAETLPEDIISNASQGTVTLTRKSDSEHDNFTMDLVTNTAVILMPNTRYHLWLCSDLEEMKKYEYNVYLGIGVNYFRDVAATGTASSCVYIYNGSEWVAYAPYIYNGTEWELYIPYIYNGTEWVLYS